MGSADLFSPSMRCLGGGCGGGCDVVAAGGAVRACRGSRRPVRLICGGWVPKTLFSSHVRRLKSSAAAGAGAQVQIADCCARGREARAASSAAADCLVDDRGLLGEDDLPAGAGEFAGDRDSDDAVGCATGVCELAPASVEASVRAPGDVDRSGPIRRFRRTRRPRTAWRSRAGTAAARSPPGPARSRRARRARSRAGRGGRGARGARAGSRRALAGRRDRRSAGWPATRDAVVTPPPRGPSQDLATPQELPQPVPAAHPVDPDVLSAADHIAQLLGLDRRDVTTDR